MYERGISALTEIMSTDMAGDAMDILIHESNDFCACCGYKQKSATGQAAVEFIEIDGIKQLIENPQRDGDAGDRKVREKHFITILRALQYAGREGLTDEELSGETGIFSDSSKAARAALVTGGWVKDLGEKRYSQNDRPMTVWGLTFAARRRLK